MKKVLEIKSKIEKLSDRSPRKDDLVKSDYAGQKLKGGSTAPEYGKVISRSGKYVYVNFGVGENNTPIIIYDLELVGTHGGRATWKEKPFSQISEESDERYKKDEERIEKEYE